MTERDDSLVPHPSDIKWEKNTQIIHLFFHNKTKDFLILFNASLNVQRSDRISKQDMQWHKS
jgi:hypothetical protein